jgi:hypothetical protein
MRHGLTIVPAGLVLVAALLGAGGPEAPPVDWGSVSDARFGMPIAPIYLVLRPDVQLDLQLKPHQVAGAKDLVSRLFERGRGLKGKPKEATEAGRRAIDEAMAAWFYHELTEAQYDRLTQITLQWEGAAAFRRSAVAEYLELNDPQRHKLARLLVDREGQRVRGSLTPADADRFAREALAILTPLQKEQWEKVLGPACRFSIGHPPAAPRNPAGNPGLTARPPAPAR